jgi:hypothetical protein
MADFDVKNGSTLTIKPGTIKDAQGPTSGTGGAAFQAKLDSADSSGAPMQGLGGFHTLMTATSQFSKGGMSAHASNIPFGAGAASLPGLDSGTALSPGGGGTMTAGGMGGAGTMTAGMNTGGDSSNALLSATKQMQETQMSFNLQYLQLQNQMQNENRSYTCMSNIMKTKHDTCKNSISNVR